MLAATITIGLLIHPSWPIRSDLRIYTHILQNKNSLRHQKRKYLLRKSKIPKIAVSCVCLVFHCQNVTASSASYFWLFFLAYEHVNKFPIVEYIPILYCISCAWTVMCAVMRLQSRQQLRRPTGVAFNDIYMWSLLWSSMLKRGTGLTWELR